MKDRIRELLYEIRPDVEFDESTNFWEDGLLDSLDLMQFIDAVEQEYDIEIDLEYIKGFRFCSYESIEGIIKEVLENGRPQ